MVQGRDEVRKIQFSGKSSYVVALPKKWVEEMGLRTGDRVMVTRQGNATLVITPRDTELSEGKGDVTIELSHNDKAGSVVRKLVSMYLLGYSTIHARTREGRLTSTQRDIVKETARRSFAGTEVIADSTEGVTIQVLLSFPELSVETALRRMFLIVASMHKDAMLALSRLDADSAKGVIRADDEVDRFSLYLMRLLKMAVQDDHILEEAGLNVRRDCLGYRLIVKSVERVADHACKMAQGVLTIRQPPPQPILSKLTELSEYALKVFEESGQALFKRDYGAADAIVERARSIVDIESDLLAAMEKGKLKESIQTVRLIVEDIRRTAEYASDIAEIVLNMTAEKVVVKQGS